MSGNGIIFVLIFKQNQLFFYYGNSNYHFSSSCAARHLGSKPLQQPREIKKQPRERFCKHRRAAETKADLVPQLVSTVKGYATHEREVLQRVTEARTAAMGATGINDKINAENALTSALAGLKVSLEAYPDLKANQNFMHLQTELSDLENKLAAARRFFNSTTRELNNAVETFPSNIFAKMFKFGKEPMFEVPQEERAVYDKAPEIKF